MNRIFLMYLIVLCFPFATQVSFSNEIKTVDNQTGLSIKELFEDVFVEHKEVLTKIGLTSFEVNGLKSFKRVNEQDTGNTPVKNEPTTPNEESILINAEKTRQNDLMTLAKNQEKPLFQILNEVEKNRIENIGLETGKPLQCLLLFDIFDFSENIGARFGASMGIIHFDQNEDNKVHLIMGHTF